MASTAAHAPTRIAMWSGPRNISTAFMRSFGNRADTSVCDEPFYAHYLLRTGLPHPGRDEVIASQENEWEQVVAALLGPVPGGRSVYYQKHMAHHLLPHMGRDWLSAVSNCFLIRDPAAMVVSLDARYRDPVLADTGLPQQREIFDRVHRLSGRIPPVIDAADLLRDPRGMLVRLCGALGIPFDEGMLAWPAGPRATDGIWARYWYDSVLASTGFRRQPEDAPQVPERLRGLYQSCLEHYQYLHGHRLVA